MISIRKSVDDLDRLDELTKRNEAINAILECYATAVQSTSHYAVEVDPGLAVEFRQHLQVIEDQSRAVASADQLRDVEASFRGELRDYRDKSAAQLTKLHKQIENATAAMMIFADTVASNGVNHGQAVQSELRTLESTSRSNSIDEIRKGIGTAVGAIESAVEQIQRSNQLVVVELEDEIRALHQQMADDRKTRDTDPASGVWNRQKIDSHLDNLLRQKQHFCLLLVSIRNFRRLESQYSRNVMDGAIKAIAGRLATIAGEESVIGRWSENQFAVVLDLPPGSVISLSAEVTRKLSGSYCVQENGFAQKVAVQATAGVVDRLPNHDTSNFLEKLEQLSSAISGA